MTGDFVHWDDPAVEPPVEGEAEKTGKIADMINGFQERNFSSHRHGFRGTHVKSQGIVKGTLTVLPDLPQHLAQGLFGHGPKEHPIAVRYSNEPSFLLDDRAPGPRGCGMKVFDVYGDFLDPEGAKTHTHDFTFNNAPILELRDVGTTSEILDIRLRHFYDKENIEPELKQRKDKDLQLAPGQLPNRHIVSYVMYSQSAYRYGDFVAKYAIFPTSSIQKALESQDITENSDPDQHAKWLREYFEKNDAEYDFKIQLCRDPNNQSVEDCSMQWDEEKYPFETVAKITIPAGQDAFDSARRAFWDDRLHLNAWLGLTAHQPLGSANRLRKQVYYASKKKREAINATNIEPVSSVDQIP